MIKKQSKTASTSSAPFEESIKLLAQATKAVGTVQRLSPKDRIRSSKIRRGGHQVVPLIATVASTYGVGSADMTGDALSAALARVQSLDSLLSASAESHATISDAHFTASGEMWSSARSLYVMLKKVAETNPSVATELQPVEEWFRYRKPAATQVDATPAPTPATTVATASTPVPAPTSATSAPVTTSTTAVPVAVTSAPAPAAVVAPAAAAAVTSIVAKAPTPVTAPTTG